MPRISTWSLSLRFPHPNLVCTSPLLHMCYMFHPSHPSWFDSLNNIWWGVQIIKLSVMQSFPLPCYLVPLRLKYLPQHPIFEHPQSTFLPQCERPSLIPHWMIASIPRVQSVLNFFMNAILIGIRVKNCTPVATNLFLNVFPTVLPTTVVLMFTYWKRIRFISYSEWSEIRRSFITLAFSTSLQNI
jgi:hypothetical protein